MDTRDQKTSAEHDEAFVEGYAERGLGAWVQRNPWLLMRLFIVMVFTFGASTTAANFSYGLEGDPTRLDIADLRDGQLPAGVELGDYVEVTGTPDFGPDPRLIGTPDSGIAVSSRYSAAYFYLGLQETGDDLLIQTAQTPPNLEETGERVWRGKLETVGTVIFHDTTQEALRRAGLPQDESIPVVTTGDTPEYYRQIFPAYSAIIGLWVGSIVWLVWRRNKPLLGM